ncbi:hypothetical protein [Oryzihumus sp.]|uniref:hypothetical protein n=1 Tax=Oryzihumus sp. TaxID=1968903 RepID=UPI002ED8F010
MASTFHGSLHEPEHVVLVRLAERGLAEGTITLDDIRGLNSREIRALLAQRAADHRGDPSETTAQPAERRRPR